MIWKGGGGGEGEKIEGLDIKKSMTASIRKARKMSHKSHMDIFKVCYLLLLLF